jgi:hypothetical protein
VRSSFKESNESDFCIWDLGAEEETKKVLYIVPPHLMDFGNYNEGDYLSTSVESIRAEEILNYFCDIKAIIEEPSEVRRYLYYHPEIGDLSRFVAEQVYNYFDSNTQLCLCINDGDKPGSEYLALFLRVSRYDDSVMDLIEKIQKSYFALLSEMTGWFLFTTDFQPLR